MLCCESRKKFKEQAEAIDALRTELKESFEDLSVKPLDLESYLNHLGTLSTLTDALLSSYKDLLNDLISSANCCDGWEDK